MLDFMTRGGPFMWIILGVSVVSIALIIERAYVLFYRYRMSVDAFMQQVTGYLDQQNFSRAIELCNVERAHPVAEVLKATLMKANESEHDLEMAIETSTIKAVPKVTKRVSYLSMLANVSTLLGLLGTIQGLIEAFRGVAQADAAAKQEILAKGIAVAMYTTFFGLVAAIPAIVAFAILQNRQNSVVSQIEGAAADLYNYLTARNRGLAASKKRA